MIQTGNLQAIQKLIMRFGVEIKKIIRDALELSYYSRGAWQYRDILMMSQGERDLALDFINERLKIASKQAFPVY